ncbi:hypothetical protein D3C76_593600 [compost metagenome]
MTFSVRAPYFDHRIYVYGHLGLALLNVQSSTSTRKASYRNFILNNSDDFFKGKFGCYFNAFRIWVVWPLASIRGQAVKTV